MNAVSGLIRSTLGALALAVLLIAPAGCAEVDANGELVGEAAEALSAPLLVSDSSVNFGTVTRGASATLNVTLSNKGTARAGGITLAVPPDPYRTAHSPLIELGINATSGDMAITFAPTAAGPFSTTLLVTYTDASDPSGKLYTLEIPVTGMGK
jgi:hypothetical protein